MKMIFAEIKIKVRVDESKLTSEQQIQVKKADGDVELDHPLEAGVENLQFAISKFRGITGLAFFGYLGEGNKAVSIDVSD